MPRAFSFGRRRLLAQTPGPIFAAILLCFLSFSITACGGHARAFSRLRKKNAVYGSVVNGSVPVSGARVTLYASGDSGYGSGAVAIGSAIADRSGSYAIPYKAPKMPELFYVVAAGGDTGAGANSAIKMLAVAGESNALSDSVTINEFTTVASEWALRPFIDPTGAIIGAPASNITGLKNSVTALLANLTDPNTGGPGALLRSVADTCGTGSPAKNCGALEQMNSLANILASCVSSASGSSRCATLFADATPYAGSAPADTLAAAAEIARNPEHKVGALFGLQAATRPFTPVSSSPPQSFVVALNFSPHGASLDEPVALAIDALGNVWTANTRGNSASELTASSGYSVGRSFAPAGARILAPTGLAFDRSGNLFIANDGKRDARGSVSELTARSGYSEGLNFSPKDAYMYQPFAIALDNASNVWVVNSESGVTELTAASSYSQGQIFDPEDASLSTPTAIAIDRASNVWVTNYYGQSVSELLAARGYDSGRTFTAKSARFYFPGALALDNSGDIWVANYLGDSVSELTAAGSYAGALNVSPAAAEVHEPASLVLDGASNVWEVNCAGRSVSELPSGCSTSQCAGRKYAPPGSGLASPYALAADASGNLWIANFSGDSITEFVGSAAPVRTPIVPGGPATP